MKELKLEVFQKNIDYLCRKHDMGVADLNRIANIDSNTLYQAKYKGYIPNLSTLVKIINVFDITLDDLVFTDFTGIEEEIARKEEEIRQLKGRLGNDGEQG